jgi:hypothetical protein
MHERALARADPRLRISGDSGGGGGGGAFGCVAIISAWPEELDEGEDRQRDDDAEPEVELAFDPNEPLFNLGEAVFGWGETVKIDAAHGLPPQLGDVLRKARSSVSIGGAERRNYSTTQRVPRQVSEGMPPLPCSMAPTRGNGRANSISERKPDNERDCEGGHNIDCHDLEN